MGKKLQPSGALQGSGEHTFDGFQGTVHEEGAIERHKQEHGFFGAKDDRAAPDSDEERKEARGIEKHNKEHGFYG